MTTEPSFKLPEDFKLSDLKDGLHEIRRELDDLWAMARDACKEETERQYGEGEHEPAITETVFEIQQLLCMVEGYVRRISTAHGLALVGAPGATESPKPPPSGVYSLADLHSILGKVIEKEQLDAKAVAE